MHSNVFVQKLIPGKTIVLTEYEAAIASSEDITPTHFAKKRRNFLNNLFHKKSPKTATEPPPTTSKPSKKPSSLKFNIMQRIRNASAKKSTKATNKRHTPEGANLSVSETSLLDIDGPGGDEHTLDTDNNEPSTSHATSSAIQPQPPRKALQNEIQPNASEEEAIEHQKSESTPTMLHKTFDTSLSSTGIRRQTTAANNVDAIAEPPPPPSSVKSTPHSTSEVSITKVSVVPAVLLCDLKAPQSQQASATTNKGAQQTVITTTSHSHLHQTRKRQVKTKSLPTKTHREESDVNRFANDRDESVVQGQEGGKKDDDDDDGDRIIRSSVVCLSDGATKGDQESTKKIHFQLEPKVFGAISCFIVVTGI